MANSTKNSWGNCGWDDDCEIRADDVVLSKSGERFNNDSYDEFVDPYDMYRHDVKAAHFKDARIYDNDLVGSDWQVPKHMARTNYKKWLARVRHEPEWVGFHRSPREVMEEFEGEDGKWYTVKKVIPYIVPGLPFVPAYNVGRPREITAKGRANRANHLKQSGSTNPSTETVNHQTSSNKSGPLLPQSRVKGARIDDEEFRAKMFTMTMGKEISKQRNALGMTQAELAKAINVDAATIRNIELGGLITFNSEDKMVKELARALNLPSIKYHD